MTILTARHAGFSLIELTIVLVIVALLSSGLIFGLSAQREITTNLDVKHQLENAKEALLGFAITNGRLPCPADPALTNSSAGAGVENCSLSKPEHGVLPWVTLGIPETDPWGQRLTYFVSTKFTAALSGSSLCSFTLETGIKKPDGLSDATGMANIRNLTSNGGVNVAIDIAAVVVSHGNKQGHSGSDEAENLDADLTFVANTPTTDFNDQLVWISQHILKSRLVAVGKLP